MFLRRQVIAPDLWGAIEWWERLPSTRRPSSPFVDSNPSFRNGFYKHGTALEAQAARYLESAQQAEQRTLDYTVVSVILTIGLFVLGIATQFRTPRVKFGLVVVGAAVFAASVGRFIDLAFG